MIYVWNFIVNQTFSIKNKSFFKVKKKKHVVRVVALVGSQVSGDFANEWFRQRHVRQRLRSLRQSEKSLRQRPTGHFANVLVYSN